MARKNTAVEWLDRALIQGPYYCLATTKKQYRAALKHLGVPKAERPAPLASPKADATTHILERAAGGLSAVVFLRVVKGRDPVSVYGLLVHEAMHIWRYYLESIGETNPSSEFEAYSVQWISQQLIDAYMRRR